MRRLCLHSSRTLLALSFGLSLTLGCSAGGDGNFFGSDSGDDDSSSTSSTSSDGASLGEDLNVNSGGTTGDVTYTYVGTERVEAYQCNPKRFPHDTSCSTNNAVTTTADNINWGEALQKALWFFNINKSGSGVFCTDTQWRGDAHTSDASIPLVYDNPDAVEGAADYNRNGTDMSNEYIAAHRAALDPDGDGMVDLSGGFYDAGDFIKFGLTSHYAATMVAWSMYEFPEAYQNTTLQPEALSLLKWFGDYFMKNTFVEDGEVIAYAHQVGDVNDHSCFWMPPEVRLTSFCPRKAYFATLERPASDQTATAAAALALIGLVYHNTGADETYAEQCLLHAMALYRFSQKNPDSVASNSSFGLYEPEYAADKMAWAAIWLAVATGDKTYLDHLVGSVLNWQTADVWSQGYLSKFPGFTSPANGWSECWTYVWRSVRTAVFTKFADVLNQLTTGMPDGRPERLLATKMAGIAREDALGWVDTPNVSPGGWAMKMPVTWGSGRYNSAGQFLSLVYAKAFPDDERAQDIKDWAKGQSEYLLGKNPLNTSYMMGFTNTYCAHPHHAAGHASIYGDLNNPLENRHILWGALVNGPTDMNDGHIDDRTDYAANEVTIDYNAAFTAALAANYATMGSTQCPIDGFPVLEDRIDEFYTRDMINDNSQPCRTQTKITLVNESIHPPRYDEKLTVRYYIDVTEFLNAGIDPATMTLNKFYDMAGQEAGDTTVAGPVPCEVNANMWYVQFGYEGGKFWGEIPILTAARTIMIDYGVENNPGCIWDSSNDWSMQGLTTAAEIKNPYVTVYSDGKLVYGEEPPCHPMQRVVVETEEPTLQ